MLRRAPKKRTHEVFGVSPEILPDSYVDRGALDEELTRLVARPTHIALRGASKCGKSWLRQSVLPDAIILQCRLGKSVLDIYTDALAELGVRLEIDSSSGTSFRGRIHATTEIGHGLFAKLGITGSAERGNDDLERTRAAGNDVNDLRFIADLIVASGRRLVIEDFHYLSVAEREAFAFDLKALWDFGVFVVIIGVWSKQNMLLFLNPDLSGRVEEVPITWVENDLDAIFQRGSETLRLEFSPEIKARAILDCYENAGVLQRLIIGMLDELGIQEQQDETLQITDMAALESAELKYAEQLNPLYQVFAERVSTGMRIRRNSTGIYAHAMAVILASDDHSLIHGLSLDRIYQSAHNREYRIQKGNLRSALSHFEELQVDDAGRGLVLSYNESSRDITVVDRQLLLYRKYSTVRWPWEDLIGEGTDSLDFDDS
jgi:hypothetical protein